MTVIPSTAMPRSDTAGPARALVVVRPAGADHRAALAAMVERASDDTLWRRFHGAGRRVVERELARIAHPTDTHRSWVACRPAARSTARQRSPSVVTARPRPRSWSRTPGSGGGSDAPCSPPSPSRLASRAWARSWPGSRPTTSAPSASCGPCGPTPAPRSSATARSRSSSRRRPRCGPSSGARHDAAPPPRRVRVRRGRPARRVRPGRAGPARTTRRPARRAPRRVSRRGRATPARGARAPLGEAQVSGGPDDGAVLGAGAVIGAREELAGEPHPVTVVAGSAGRPWSSRARRLVGCAVAARAARPLGVGQPADADAAVA